MKLTVFFIICAFAASAQTKIDFRDGKSMTLNGKSLGTFVIYDFFEPTVVSKHTKNFYKVEGDTIEIAVYTEWEGGRMDDLRIYRIHKNQINTEISAISEAYEENGSSSYSYSFHALDEQQFGYKTYSIYSSTGEAKEFNVFTIESNQKEGFEVLFLLINN